METLVQHKGEWRAYTDLRCQGKVLVEDMKGEVRGVRKKDLKEGNCVILGKRIWRVFLYDYVRQRYFLELAYEAENKIDLYNAFDLLSKECF